MFSLGINRPDGGPRSFSVRPAGCCATPRTTAICVDLENITPFLASIAYSDIYKGKFSKGTLCDMPEGTQGCVSIDKDTGIIDTKWFSGKDWPKGAAATVALCEGAAAVVKSKKQR